MSTQSKAATFAATFAALHAAHQVADHWIQTNRQAADKGKPGWPGRRACAAHVATYTATQGLALAAVQHVTGARISPRRTVAALAVSAVSHYWADRRTTLAALCEATGRGGFYRLGAPRPDHDDNPSLGTGAYALDQSFHIAFLYAAALVIAGGAQ